MSTPCQMCGRPDVRDCFPPRKTATGFFINDIRHMEPPAEGSFLADLRKGVPLEFAGKRP